MPALLKKKSKQINLLPEDESDKSLGGRIARWILGTFRTIVILVELVVIAGFLTRFYFDSQNSDLTDEINQKKALIESYSDFEKTFRLVQQKLEILNNFAYKNASFSDLSAKVFEKVATEITLQNVSLNGNTLNLTILSKSEQAIANFQKNLRAIEGFQNSHIQQIESSQIDGTIRARLVIQTQRS